MCTENDDRNFCFSVFLLSICDVFLVLLLSSGVMVFFVMLFVVNENLSIGVSLIKLGTVMAESEDPFALSRL